MSKVKKKYIFKNLNRKLFTLIFISGILSFGVQIYFTSQVGTKSTEIELIRNQKEELRLENEILKSRIDQSLSTNTIEEVIEDLGLQEKDVKELINREVSAEGN